MPFQPPKTHLRQLLQVSPDFGLTAAPCSPAGVGTHVRKPGRILPFAMILHGQELGYNGISWVKMAVNGNTMTFYGLTKGFEAFEFRRKGLIDDVFLGVF